jgi:acyl-CoA thioester hydrolase
MDENIQFHHSCPIQIRFTDVDMMSHVTNSLHLSYCDVARISYFDFVLGESIEQTKESLVIASITIDYKIPILIKEKIEVLTKTSKIGNKSIHTLQHIINTESGEIKSVIRTAISGFDYEKQISIVVPSRWKDKLAAFERDVEYKY